MNPNTDKPYTQIALTTIPVHYYLSHPNLFSSIFLLPLLTNISTTNTIRLFLSSSKLSFPTICSYPNIILFSIHNQLTSVPTIINIHIPSIF